MKVLLVSDAGSIHTKRWTASLKRAGVDIVVFSITPATDGFYTENGIRLSVFDLFNYPKKGIVSRFKALHRHIRAVHTLRRVIESERPDILHAHYATSYGLVAALSGFHPLLMSVWGSDVYEFPYLSKLNALAVRFMLGKAEKVLSTSKAMAQQTSRFYNGKIEITPFGVDTRLFDRDMCRSDCGEFVIGTVKTLSEKYGIDTLIEAFALFSDMVRSAAEVRPAGADGHTGADIPAEAGGLAATVRPVRLVIAGRGKDRAKLERLAERLGIADKVEFLGAVEHSSLPDVFARFDVAVFLSREESFGVAAIEAMACRRPVIASDAVGFKEIIEDGCGIIVPKNNPQAAADAMFALMTDDAARSDFAENGRQRVVREYEWSENVAAMVKIYKDVLTETEPVEKTSETMSEKSSATSSDKPSDKPSDKSFDK